MPLASRYSFSCSGVASAPGALACLPDEIRARCSSQDLRRSFWLGMRSRAFRALASSPASSWRQFSPESGAPAGLSLGFGAAGSAGLGFAGSFAGAFAPGFTAGSAPGAGFWFGFAGAGLAGFAGSAPGFGVGVTVVLIAASLMGSGLLFGWGMDDGWSFKANHLDLEKADDLLPHK